MTGEKLSSIQVADMDIIYWSVRSSSMRGGDGVNGVNGGYRSFCQLQVNLVRDPSINKSILETHTHTQTF